MQLEILHGQGGTGKTAMLLEAARLRAADPAAATWMVVPDQSTFIMEKRVLETLGDRDGNRIRVFSLNRLAWHLIANTGGSPRPFLDTSGKGVLVYRIMREYQERLPLFSDTIRRGGFTKVAGDLLAEFKRYGVTPEGLHKAATEVPDPRLAIKLQELAVIGEAYDAAMDGHGYLDGEDRLKMAAERLSRMPDISAIHVCLDQFQRFSPVQLQLIRSLIVHAASVSVSLRMDAPDDEAMPGHQRFGQSQAGRPAWFAVAALTRFAAENGIPVVQTSASGKDWRHAPGSGLAFLAGNLSPGDTGIYQGIPADIRTAAHPDPSAEIHACARQIVGLCRDGGCRFRDMAVLVPDSAEYAAIIRRVFRLHHIPFFMDRKESLAGNPVAVALLAPFDILRGGWRHDDAFRLLKTGLLPVAQSAADRLENHALATGLRGRRLWCEHPLEDKEMEEVRVLLTTPLQAFRQCVRGQVPVRAALEAYLAMLMAWRLPQRIASRAKMLEESGNLAIAGHMRQIWQSACDLMDQILELSGEGTLTLTELHGMLQTGLEGGSTGIIPPSLDEVFVGTPSRSQVSQARHLFVPGMAEGWIPAASGGQGLLTDADRRMMALHGLELAPDTREMSRERREELNAVITMPTEGLWLSRPVSDTEGKALQPSPVFAEVRGKFPTLKEGWVPDADGAAEPWYPETLLATTPRAFLEVLVPWLRENDSGNPSGPLDGKPPGSTALSGSTDKSPFGTPAGPSSLIVELFNSCGRQPGMKTHWQRVADGLQWRNDAALSPGWFRERYGAMLSGSISSMETYRRCPFSWFARNAALLREREVCGLRDVGFGLLMHEVMDAVFSGVETDGGWDTYDAASLPISIGAAVRQGVAHGTGISPLHPGLASWFSDRLAKAALTAASRIVRQIQAGTFRPIGHELGFGDQGVFPPFVVPLPNGGTMRLQGRLDRLDLHEAADGLYVRVVDYKSGDRSLALSDVMNGLSLQLPAYLVVALASLREKSHQAGGRPVIPAGIFHMRLEPPDIRTGDGSASGADAERNRRMRLSGYVLDDPAVLTAMDHQIAITGSSDVVRASLNRDGTIAGRTRTLSRRGFERMGTLLGILLGEMGERLVAGDVTVSPVRTGGERACDHCPYGWVCRFEPGVGNVGWNRLPVMAEADVRRMLNKVGNGVRHEVDG